MYSKICPTKVNLVGHIPKWVRKWPVTGDHYFKLCKGTLEKWQYTVFLTLYLVISKPFIIVTRIMPCLLFSWLCCDWMAVIDSHKCFIILVVILWDGVNNAFTGVVCSDCDHRIVWFGENCSGLYWWQQWCCQLPDNFSHCPVTVCSKSVHT